MNLLKWMRDRWMIRSPLVADPTAVSVYRISLCAALLISELFRYDYGLLLRSSAAMKYQPIGPLLALFPNTPAPIGVVNAIRVVAVVATVLAFIGLFTRPMFVLSVVSSWFLASTMYEFVGGWSHEYNAMLLAALSLFFAPIDRALSVDAIRHRSRDRAPASVLACNAPAFAAQFMIAWMFFNAFCYKSLVSGSAWWRTDNLRNILSFQWIGAGAHTPGYVMFVADHVAVFRSFAVGSMLAQASMALALIFFRRPYRRALFGLAFVGETLGLGFMMARWDISPVNPHWLVLYAVFIDWNYFLGGRYAPAPGEAISRLSQIDWMPEWRRWAWPAALVATEFVMSLATLGRLVPAAFPFTAYPMYSGLSGKALGGHSSFEFIGPRFNSSDVDVSLGSALARKAYGGNFYASLIPDLDDLRGRLLQTQGRLTQASATPPTLALFETIYSVPAYPAPIRLQVSVEGIRGVVGHNGEFAGVSASAHRLATGEVRIDFTQHSMDLSAAPSVVAIPIDYRGVRSWGRVHSKAIYAVGAPKTLQGTWMGLSFTTTDLAPGAYILAVRARPIGDLLGETRSYAEALFFTGPIVEL